MTASAPNSANTPRWAVAVHGGAGTLPRNLPGVERRQIHRTLTEALESACAALRAGGRSLDAVQCAVRVMEASGVLNAGRGAVLNRDGVAELDAALMDGRERRAGAVGAVRRIAHPIDLARMLLDQGRHVMLVGAGAEEFALASGVTPRPDAFFVTERRRAELARAQAAPGRVRERPDASEGPGGTVGAVALDVHGDLAAATSTGGLTNKLPGRIGDSPLIGAGTFAENGVCAVSTTGAGEYFVRFCAASDVAARVKYQGRSLLTAAEEVIAAIRAAGGRGGLIAVDARGAVAMPYSAASLLRGAASSERAPQVTV